MDIDPKGVEVWTRTLCENSGSNIPFEDQMLPGYMEVVQYGSSQAWFDNNIKIALDEVCLST